MLIPRRIPLREDFVELVDILLILSMIPILMEDESDRPKDYTVQSLWEARKLLSRIEVTDYSMFAQNHKNKI